MLPIIASSYLYGHEIVSSITKVWKQVITLIRKASNINEYTTHTCVVGDILWGD